MRCRIKGCEAVWKVKSAAMIVKSMTLINKSKALIDKSKAMIWIFSDIVVTFDFVEGIFVRQYRNKKVFLFCIVLTFS